MFTVMCVTLPSVLNALSMGYRTLKHNWFARWIAVDLLQGAAKMKAGKGRCDDGYAAGVLLFVVSAWKKSVSSIFPSITSDDSKQ